MFHRHKVGSERTGVHVIRRALGFCRKHYWRSETTEIRLSPADHRRGAIVASAQPQRGGVAQGTHEVLPLHRRYWHVICYGHGRTEAQSLRGRSHLGPVVGRSWRWGRVPRREGA